jgi:cellulose biosynthesis protein BcsQ
MNMRVLATYNIKGGVGKTTSAVNLAYAAAKEGQRVLVWDLDAQGAASFYFRVKPKIKGGFKKLLNQKRQLIDAIKETNYPSIDLVPADFKNRNLDVMLADSKHAERRLTELLATVDQEYDLVFLDCPPSLSLTSENVFAAADALLIPLIPTYLSIRAYKQLRDYRNDSDGGKLMLMPFFSMVDIRRKLHCELVDGFHLDHPEVMRIFIAYSSVVEQMGRYRAPVHVFAGSSPVAKSFFLLWHEIRKRLEKLAPAAPP